MHKEDVQNFWTKSHELLVAQCIFGAVHVKILRQMRDTISTEPSLFENGKIFFTMTFKAHEDDSIMTLARLFKEDKRKDSLTIKSLLNFIDQQAPQLVPTPSAAERLREMVARDLESLKQLQDLLDKIETQRDKFYSHLDKVLLRGEQEGLNTPTLILQHKVTLDEMKSLFDLAGDLLNRYSREISGTTNQIGIVRDDDFKDVHRLMKKAVEVLRSEQSERIDALEKRTGRR